MTVKELIKNLESMPPEMPVVVQYDSYYDVPLYKIDIADFVNKDHAFVQSGPLYNPNTFKAVRFYKKLNPWIGEPE